MNQELQPHPQYPEARPDLTLISLRELYSLQPWQVLNDHLEHIRLIEIDTDRLIAWHEIELLDRKDGVEDLPAGFEEFQESVEGESPESLQETINGYRDKMLTILSHYSVLASTNIYKQGD